MKIVLIGNEIKKIMLFTSNLESRAALQGVSIKNEAGKLEIVATDGAALMMYRRKLDAGEELAPNSSIILKMPKLKYKNTNYAITQEGEKYFINGLGEESICPKIEFTYPNYNIIVDGWEKIPEASDFAMFSAENIKRLEAVADGYGMGRPKANNANTPHFWEKHENGADYLVVLMPCHI